MAVQSISDIKKQHLGEWLLIRVESLDRHSQPHTGELLAHSPNKQVIVELDENTSGFLYRTFVPDPDHPGPICIL
jgi:hypothetical protein